MNEWENSSPNLREPYKNCTKKHYHDFNNGEFSFNYPFNNKNEKVVELLKDHDLIPVCPEIMGGLPTPRIPSEINGNEVITRGGKNVTKQYQKGAEETLKIAKLYNCHTAILKEKSPSCGCGKVYDGTFTGTLINGDGITARLLKEHGIKITGETTLDITE